MRVLVVEDGALLRTGLAHIIRAAGHAVATAADATQAAGLLADTTPPDVAVVDIRLPPTHTDEGLRLAARLRALGAGVLLLSQHAVPEYAVTLLGKDPRGCGYLLKDRVVDTTELLAAIGRIAEGGTVIDEDIADMVARAARRPSVREPLTEREMEILALLTQGLTDRGIAERLFISTHTVVSHVQRIFRKLEIPNTAADNRRVLAVLAYLRR